MGPLVTEKKQKQKNIEGPQLLKILFNHDQNIICTSNPLPDNKF